MPILAKSKPKTKGRQQAKKASSRPQPAKPAPAKPTPTPAPEPAAEPITIKTVPPDRPYANMVCAQLGTLAPETPFYFPDGYQFLTGLVIYQSFGNTFCRCRILKPLTSSEVVEELTLSSGAWVLVKQGDYDAQQKKEIRISTAEIRGKFSMEGFPEM